MILDDGSNCKCQGSHPEIFTSVSPSRYYDSIHLTESLSSTDIDFQQVRSRDPRSVFLMSFVGFERSCE